MNHAAGAAHQPFVFEPEIKKSSQPTTSHDDRRDQSGGKKHYQKADGTRDHNQFPHGHFAEGNEGNVFTTAQKTPGDEQAKHHWRGTRQRQRTGKLQTHFCKTGASRRHDTIKPEFAARPMTFEHSTEHDQSHAVHDEIQNSNRQQSIAREPPDLTAPEFWRLASYA